MVKFAVRWRSGGAMVEWLSVGFHSFGMMLMLKAGGEQMVQG